MKLSLTLGSDDTVEYMEDFGYPAGIRLGDVEIWFTDDRPVQALLTATFAYETEIRLAREQARRKFTDDYEDGGELAGFGS